MVAIARFRLLLNSTSERLEFTPIGGPVPNRGSQLDSDPTKGQLDIELQGARYLQRVSDANSHEALHIEPGYGITFADRQAGIPDSGFDAAERRPQSRTAECWLPDIVLDHTIAAAAHEYGVHRQSESYPGAGHQGLRRRDYFIDLTAGIERAPGGVLNVPFLQIL